MLRNLCTSSTLCGDCEVIRCTMWGLSFSISRYFHCVWCQQQQADRTKSLPIVVRVGKKTDSLRLASTHQQHEFQRRQLTYSISIHSGGDCRATQIKNSLATNNGQNEIFEKRIFPIDSKRNVGRLTISHLWCVCAAVGLGISANI